jgi:glutamine synthetase
MKDFEEQAYKLGIPLKTRHNEVAPKHHLQVIFHEKSDLRVTDMASNGCQRHTREV